MLVCCVLFSGGAPPAAAAACACDGDNRSRPAVVYRSATSEKRRTLASSDASMFVFHERVRGRCGRRALRYHYFRSLFRLIVLPVMLATSSFALRSAARGNGAVATVAIDPNAAATAIPAVYATRRRHPQHPSTSSLLRSTVDTRLPAHLRY